jgi:hypothetical protein
MDVDQDRQESKLTFLLGDLPSLFQSRYSPGTLLHDIQQWTLSESFCHIAQICSSLRGRPEPSLGESRSGGEVYTWADQVLG